jgi:hypothetical protein
MPLLEQTTETLKMKHEANNEERTVRIYKKISNAGSHASI